MNCWSIGLMLMRTEAVRNQHQEVSMYHLHIHRLSQGLTAKAMNAFDYICRTGEYVTRGDRVRLVDGVHFPKWAVDVIGAYWVALDSFDKRSNARLLYTIEVAIPRALSVHQQNELVRKLALFVARTSSKIGRRVGVPVAYAIHEGIRSDDATTGRLPNPHVHLLVSTSIDDGVGRKIPKWFMRSNSAKPKKGGAPRSKVIGGLRWLKRVRRGWAKLANTALRAAGLPERIDHRSYRARGLEQLPTLHMGPYAAAAARAGKPVPIAKKNASIKAYNEERDAWEVRRRKLEETERLLNEQDSAAFVLDHDDSRSSSVRVLLNQHPFARDQETAVAAASIIVQDDRAVPSQPFNGGVIDLIKRLRKGLDHESVLVPDRDRVWILREGGDCITVAGSNYVACDSARTGVGAWVGRMAIAMGITSVIAHTPLGNDAVRCELEDWMSVNGGQCRWRDAAAASVPPQSRRPRL